MKVLIIVHVKFNMSDGSIMPKTRHDPEEYVSKEYINFNKDRSSFLGFASLYLPAVYMLAMIFFRFSCVCP